MLHLISLKPIILMKSLFIICCMTAIFCFANGQSGPGGIGDVTGNSILQLWLRADTGIVINPDSPERVKQWLDFSGANNHLTAAKSKRPFYNAPPDLAGVKFNGKHYLQAPASASFNNPTATVFIVKKKSFKGAAISLSPGGFSQEMLILDRKVYHHHSSGNWSAQSSACLESMPDNEICIVEAVWGPGTTEVTNITNGLVSTDPLTQLGAQAVLSPINRKITLGQRDVFTSSQYLVGTIMEVIGYNVKLSDVQRKAVEDYLACKYGIANPTCGNLTDCGGKHTEGFEAIGEEINIYPNPASGQLHIDLGTTFSNDLVNLRVVNLLGQTLISQQVNMDEFGSSVILPIDQLSSGNYLLIAEQNNVTASKKFVVQ